MQQGNIAAAKARLGPAAAPRRESLLLSARSQLRNAPPALCELRVCSESSLLLSGPPSRPAAPPHSAHAREISQPPRPQAVADVIRTTLGPRSMLKMILDASGGEQLLLIRTLMRTLYT